MRPRQPVCHPHRTALTLACCMLVSARAWAAADDLSALQAPIAPPQAAIALDGSMLKPAPEAGSAAPGVRKNSGKATPRGGARKLARNGAKEAPKEGAASTGGAGGVAGTTRRLAEDVVRTQHVVAQVLRENVVSRVMASSWRASAGAPFVTRATSIGAPTPLPGTGSDAPAQATLPEDSPLGARWHVVRADADTHVPSVSWMPDSQNATTAGSALRPKTSLAGEWALPNDFSVGVMPGMAVDLKAQGKRQATGTLAVTVGKAWSPQWRTFVDMARERLDSIQIGGAATTLDAGVSFAASTSTKIDFALTRGLSDASSAPFQAGVGVSSSF